MARGIKAHTIPDEIFKKAIDWLENGGTKKGACEILDVGSNATMERLIQEWNDSQVLSAEMRKKKRGTPLTEHEIVVIIESYLQGDSLESIADRLYRSAAMVKAEIDRRGANLKYSDKLDPAKPLELHPPELPEQVMSDTFAVGEQVWVAAYQCMGEVTKVMDNDVYRVYLLAEDRQKYVHQYAWDLGSMKDFEKLGVNVKSLGYHGWTRDVTIPILNEALAKARKQAAEDKRK